MKDPKALLERVMVLIEKDIEHIETSVENEKLSHYSAQDLARYSQVLFAMAKSKEEEQEQKRKHFRHMPTDELYRLALQAKGGLDEDTKKGT
jgi:hypothetical protein